MRTRLRRLLLLAGAVGAWSNTANADFYWVGGSGSWTNPINWSDALGGAGSVGVPGDGDWVFLQFNDAINRTILGTPSNSPFSFGRFETGAQGGGTVTLNITQGTFGNGNDQLLGLDGQFAIVQTGGANLAAGVQMASSGTATVSYDLFAGRFAATGLLRVGGNGNEAVVRQQGGAGEFLGLTIASNSRYELSGGSLVTGFYEADGIGTQIDPGARFVQTGGLSTAEDLNVLGRYEWSAGSLNVTRKLQIAGDFVFPASPIGLIPLNIDGLLDVSADTTNIVNGSNVSMNLTSTSLVLRSAAVDPATLFGSFNNAGLTHVVGTPLAVPAGRTLHLGFELNDPVDCSGSISAVADRVFALNGTLKLRSGGFIDATGGVIRLSAGTSEIQGGKLITSILTLEGNNGLIISLPPPPPPTAIQTGGEVTADIFQTYTNAGTYILSGGSLSTGSTIFGKKDLFRFPTSGTIIQNAGTHTISGQLILAQGDGSAGTYLMNGGTLRANDVRISDGARNTIFPPGPLFYGDGRFQVTTAAAAIYISNSLTFGPKSSYAAGPGTVIHMSGTGGFGNMNADPAALAGLANTTLIFENVNNSLGPSDPAPFEVAGIDLGPTPAGFDSNFVLCTLNIGGSNIAGLVLVDSIDNQPASPEALYVDTLILGPGSYLDLNGLNLYCLNFINNGGSVIDTAGGSLTVVPEPAELFGVAALLALSRRRRKAGLSSHR